MATTKVEILTINVQQNNPDVRVECTLILSVLLWMTNPDDCDKYLLIGTWLYSGMRPEWKQMIGAGKRTLSTLSTCEVSYTLLVSRWVLSRFAAGQFCWYLPWPQFVKWMGVLPRDLAKSRRFEFRLFQPHCRGACQILERDQHYNIQFRGLEISRYLAVRRLIT